MRITVNKTLSYETELPVAIGDLVELPLLPWQSAGSGGNFGRVTALDSTYSGPCKRVMRIVEPATTAKVNL